MVRSLLAMFAILVLVACGSDNVVIVEEQVTVESGQTISYELDEGTYDVQLTVTGPGIVGINVAWEGTDCDENAQSAGGSKNWRQECEVNDSARLLLTTGSVLEPEKIVIIKITQLK